MNKGNKMKTKITTVEFYKDGSIGISRKGDKFYRFYDKNSHIVTMLQACINHCFESEFFVLQSKLIFYR